MTGTNGTNKSSNNSNNSGSGSSSNNASSAFDPTTFKQYDKYKDSKDALFGDVEKGTGAELGANMKAGVYYKGWLTDGTLFDQSKTDEKGQKQPFVFTEGAHQVIPGWEQGVAGMKVGGTRLIIVPPAAGYGTQGQGTIPPNAVMIFEVQLVAVQ
jgi:FKBP-type peptidyl-prolyl cis-trans isomerase FkpA